MQSIRPSVITRARFAWKLFRHGMPPYRKAAPFAWPVWRQGKPEWHIVDYSSYVTEGFNANALIYGAIMYKVRAMMSAPLRAYKGDRDRPNPLDESHPLAKLVARPNPHQSWEELQTQSTVYFNVAGNCYILMDRPVSEGLPDAMYALRPDRTWIVPKPKRGGQRPELIGYLYVPEGKRMHEGLPILPQNMMHVKLPNPWDPLEGMGYGLSPISAMARNADVDNMATKFLQMFFQRGAMPQGLLSFDIDIDDDTASEIAERFKEMYGGFDQWDKVPVLGRGGTYERITPTFEEMSFENIDERNESRILGPLGVPPILIGTRVGLERATYSNYDLAERNCWENTLIPENRLFEVEYQYYLSEGDEFVMYDYSKVPALQKNIPELAEAAFQMWQMGVPANIAFDKVGLDMEDLPEGDQAYTPFNMMPVGETRPQLPAGAPMGAVEELGKSLDPPSQRKQLCWKAIDRMAESWEGRFALAAENQLDTDRRRLLAILNEGKKQAQRQKATVNWEAIYASWMDYLDEAGEAWRKAFIPLIKGVVKEQGAQLNTMFGMAFDVENLFAQTHFDTYTLTFARPIMDTTKKTLTAMFRQALHEGWSIPEMQKYLELVFRQWMKGDLSEADFEWFAERMPAHRREAIARTETMRASNYGNYELQREWGVEKSQWWTTLDGRERDTHHAAHKQVRPAGEPFDVGGHRLMYPLDSSLGAPVEEIINCRCIPLPYKEEWFAEGEE